MAESFLRATALGIFQAALAAADPRRAIRRTLQREGHTLVLTDPATGQTAATFDLRRGRVVVVGAGKADAAMAQAVEGILGDALAGGIVNVKYGHRAPVSRIRLHEAGHPLLDENSLAGTQRILEQLQGLTAEDLVLCLFSGGGSALMELLVVGVTLEDMRACTDLLLKAGATINELNTLRKHLSQVKGGQLARWAQPAQVVALILSDVLGSPLDVIASGPTAPDSSTFAEAWSILEKYGLEARAPASIRAHLQRGERGEVPDTPKDDDPLFARVHNVIIADNAIACAAAVEQARAAGFAPLLLSTLVEGEAREVAKVFAAIGKEIAHGTGPVRRPACVLAGGETTVTVRGAGVGGRNQEFVLAAALALRGVEGVLVLSGGTDGTDGPNDAAGAVADGRTVRRAEALGMKAQAFLANNDSYSFFRALGDLIITGPTNTNVNDLMLVLVA